ncbi:MAG TPA: TauD/TfdA family dioxygenase [Allosphingosinicella sp.]|jgi:hypothetical protein
MRAAPLDSALACAVLAAVAVPAAGCAGAPSTAAAPLAALVQDRLDRCGWVRLRLFDSEDVVNERCLERLLLEISAELGFIVAQTAAGTRLARIEDAGQDYASHKTRGHQTGAELAFHSDRCDVNLLLYVHAAQAGGEISVVGYDEAAARLEQVDPDACATLFDGFPFDLREERAFPSIAWHWRPILWRTESGIRGHYIRRFITDSQRHGDCPRLTSRQAHALDRFDAVLDALRAERSFAPLPGDLLALGNYRVMHARSSFADDGPRRRLALRTWIAPFASERLPLFLHPLTGCCEPGANRGGVAPAYEHHSGRDAGQGTAAGRIDHD